jgi:hypothetical protein
MARFRDPGEVTPDAIAEADRWARDEAGSPS